MTDWQHLNLNYVAKAEIDQEFASNAAAATSPARTPRIRRSSPSVDGVRKFVVNEAECVGCNLCVPVCPVEHCITLVHKTEGVDPRTGLD